MCHVFVDTYECKQKSNSQKLGCSSLCFTCQVMLIYFGSFLIFVLIFFKKQKETLPLSAKCRQNVFTTQCYISARTGCNLTIFLSVQHLIFLLVDLKSQFYLILDIIQPKTTRTTLDSLLKGRITIKFKIKKLSRDIQYQLSNALGFSL